MMVNLMKCTLYPPQVLCFSAQLPFYTKFTSFGFSSGETSMFWSIKVKNRRNLLFLSKSIREDEDVIETGEVFSLFRVLGLDEKGTEAVFMKNPGLGLLSVEAIRSRIRGLQSIGINEVGLIKLISKKADILTAEEVGELIEFIHDGLENKIESSQIERLLRNTQPSFIGGFGKKVLLLVEYGIPEEKIAHILNNISLSKGICLRSSEEIQRMLTFLSRFDAVGIIAKRPSTLHYDLDDQLVPRVGFLQKLSGGNTECVGEALNRLPAIVSYSVEHLQNHVEFFRSFGLTDEEVFKIILVYPNVMSASVDRKLRPRVEFLKECGLVKEEIYRFLVKSPLFLGLSFERNLALKLATLVKIGYSYRTKELAMAIGAATRTRCEYLQGVISLFLSYGFSCDDIIAMSNKHFQLLQYNPKSLEEKMEYLIEDMDREIGELLSFPAFLGYNLDNRIKHRYELKKKIVGQDMSLNKLLCVSAEQFSKTKKDVAKVRSTLVDEDTDADKMVLDMH